MSTEGYQALSTREDEEYQTSGLRWLVLFIFSLLSFSNAIMWITYGALEPLVRPAYNVSEFQYALLSSIYAIIFLPFAPVAAALAETRGLRPLMVLSGLLNVAAGVVRYFSTGKNGFWWALAGQTLGALSQAGFIAAPPKISGVWFPEHERAKATSFGVFANQLGIAIGMGLPSAVTTMQGFRVGLLVQACLCLVASVLIIWGFREKPEHPPDKTGTSPHLGWSTIARLCMNRSFILLTVAAGVGFGAFWDLSTVLSQVLTAKTTDYPSWYVGTCGVLLVAAGLLSLGTVGFLVDKTHAYKIILVSGFLLSSGGVAALAALTETKWGGWDPTAYLVWLVAAVVGLVLCGLQPVILEAGVEVTYPAPEEVSSGILFWSGNGVYVAFLYSSDGLCNAKTGDCTPGLWLLVGCFLLSGLVILGGFVPDYKRLNSSA